MIQHDKNIIIVIMINNNNKQQQQQQRQWHMWYPVVISDNV